MTMFTFLLPESPFSYLKGEQVTFSPQKYVIASWESKGTKRQCQPANRPYGGSGVA